MSELTLTSPNFTPGGLIPLVHTGYGADVSPELVLEGLSPATVTLAVTMDDLGHPIPPYNHWVIWNIPAVEAIPGNLPHGEVVATLGGARQGRGYGRHRYRGPKPPFQWSHEYQFTVYALDARLDLPNAARKKDLLVAMNGHILQQASLTGHYR